MFPLKCTLKRSVNYSNCCWLLIYIHWTNQLLVSALIGRSICTKKSCIFCQIITLSLFVKPQKTSEFPRIKHSSVPHGSRVARPGFGNRTDPTPATTSILSGPLIGLPVRYLPLVSPSVWNALFYSAWWKQKQNKTGSWSLWPVAHRTWCRVSGASLLHPSCLCTLCAETKQKDPLC